MGKSGQANVQNKAIKVKMMEAPRRQELADESSVAMSQ